VYVDATLGGGGHTLEILKQLGQGGTIIAIDRDTEAIKRFAKKLESMEFKSTKSQKDILRFNNGTIEIVLVNLNYSELSAILKKIDIKEVDGIIADLGLSSDQIDDSKRGFTFLKKEELDMRMDTRTQVKAKDLLNGLYEKELKAMFTKLSDITFAGRLAKEIVKRRQTKIFTNTAEIKQIIQKIVPFSKRQGTQKNPEAKVFQALRIAVNDELSSLQFFLPHALESLCFGGKLVVISFHSGEDRIVKQAFKQSEREKEGSIIGEIIKPSEEEVSRNPRSRSAKMRVIQKNELLRTKHKIK